MFCRDCGQQLQEDWVVCPKCGMATDDIYAPLTSVEKDRIREEERIRAKEQSNSNTQTLAGIILFPIRVIAGIIFLLWLFSKFN
ncbi:MAG: hypothetical protein AB9917_01975 [Negativicutes bacterium]